MLCPDLLSHVKTEVERDAALAKKPAQSQGRAGDCPQGWQGWEEGGGSPLIGARRLSLEVDRLWSPTPSTACFGRKPRDIFPLPLLDDDLKPRAHLSRKVVRRVLVEGHLRREANHTLRSLNSMYGCPTAGNTFSVVGR